MELEDYVLIAVLALGAAVVLVGLWVVIRENRREGRVRRQPSSSITLPGVTIEAAGGYFLIVAGLVAMVAAIFLLPDDDDDDGNEPASPETPTSVSTNTSATLDGPSSVSPTPSARISPDFEDGCNRAGGDRFATVVLNADDAGAGARYEWTIQSRDGASITTGEGRSYRYQHDCQTWGDRFVARLHIDSPSGPSADNGDTVIVRDFR